MQRQWGKVGSMIIEPFGKPQSGSSPRVYVELCSRAILVRIMSVFVNDSISGIQMLST